MLRYLTISSTPSRQILELLNNNLIGTPGVGMLYQHLGVQNKIHKIPEPYYLALDHLGHVAGTCCFCRRLTTVNGEMADSFYIRYFTFNEIFRRKNISVKRKPNSGIKQEVERVLSGYGITTGNQEKYFHYAYVDPRNPRSMLLCNEFGFKTYRHYTTLIFNRIFPKEMEGVVETETSNPDIQSALLSIYSGYNTFSLENLNRKYYYLKSGDKIVAGLQVNPDKWRVHTLPGKNGKLMLSIFNSVPLLNRMMSKVYSFLAVEAIITVPGHEQELEQLLEHVCAIHKVHSAIIVTDLDSNLYSLINRIDRGVFSKLSPQVKGDVIFRFNNYSQQEMDQFKAVPVYVSTIDVT